VNTRSRAFLGALLLAAAASAGCSLPNLRPFSEATQELRESVHLTQRQVQENLDALARQDAERFKVHAEAFAQIWKTRLDLLDALLDYSASLASIAEAGEGGGRSVEAVGDSLKQLTAAAGQAGLIAQAALDAGGLIYNVIATVRAEKSLRTAVLAADPAIQDIAANLDKDFETLSEKVQSRAVLNAAKSFIEERYVKEHGFSNSYRATLVGRMQALRDDLAGALKATPLDKARVQEIQSSVALLEPLLKSADALFVAKNRDYEAVERNWQAGSALFAGARTGFRRWAAIHRQLASSLQSGSPLNVALLVTTVHDLKALLEEVKKK